MRGKRAKSWRLVDIPLSRFEDRIGERAQEVAATAPAPQPGIELTELTFEQSDAGYQFEYVDLSIEAISALRTLTMRAPHQSAAEIAALSAEAIRAQGENFWAFKAYRELNEALLHLRLTTSKSAQCPLKHRAM